MHLNQAIFKSFLYMMLRIYYRIIFQYTDIIRHNFLYNFQDSILNFCHLKMLRNRKYRAKSTIPYHCYVEEEHYLLWLNAENRQSQKNSSEKNYENADSKQDKKEFETLEEVWNSGFFNRMLNSVSSKYFGDSISSAFSIIENLECSFEDGSSTSVRQRKKYTEILQKMQNYIRQQIGKSIIHHYSQYFLTLQKLTSLLLFISINCTHRHRTAKIILSLPQNSQQFLHNKIKEIQQSLQTIKDYKQILKALERLQIQNTNLNNQLIELLETISEQKQELDIKKEEYIQLSKYCRRLEEKLEGIVEKLRVGCLEDLEIVVERMRDSYEKEMRYSQILHEQNSMLEKDLQKLSAQIFQRNSIILQLTQKLQTTNNINIKKEDSDLFISTNHKFLPLQSVLSPSFSEQNQSRNDKIDHLPIFSVHHSKNMSSVQTKYSELLPTKQFSLCSSNSSFNRKGSGLGFFGEKSELINSSSRTFGEKFKEMNYTNFNVTNHSNIINLNQPNSLKPTNIQITSLPQSPKLFESRTSDPSLITKNQQLIFHTTNLQNKIARLQQKDQRHHKKIQKIIALHNNFCQNMKINDNFPQNEGNQNFEVTQ